MPNGVEIDKYKIGWGATTGAVIRVHFKESGTWSQKIYVPAEQASFVAGMLRNEKPLYLYETDQIIGTGPEIAGEEESG